MIVPRTTLVDTQAPRPRVKSDHAGLDRRARGGARADRGRLDLAPPDQARPGLPDRRRRAAARGRARSRGGLAHAGLGRPRGRRARAARHVPGQGDRARPRLERRLASRARIPPVRGSSRGEPGITIRALAAEPPVRPVTSGQKVTINVDARGRPVPLAAAARGRQEAGGSAAAGPRASRSSCTAPGGDSGLYALELFAGPAPHGGARHGPVARARRAARRPARAHLDGHGAGRPGRRRHRRTRSRRRAGELAARVRRRPAARPLRHGRAAAALPRRGEDPLRPHQRPRPRLSRGPRPTDRKAVLFAGSQRWITRAYGRRLRRYVLEGGRLASFGAESMRRGVTILRNRDDTAGRLVRPTQPVDPGSVRDAVRGRPPHLDAGHALPDRRRRRPTGSWRASTARSTGFSVLEESRRAGGRARSSCWPRSGWRR